MKSAERLTDEQIADWVKVIETECLTNVGTEMLREIQAECLARGRERDETRVELERINERYWGDQLIRSQDRAERAEGELKDLRSRMYDCQQGGKPCPHCSNAAEQEGSDG